MNNVYISLWRGFVTTVAPGGLLSGPRAYQNQFRGFNKSHRVHARRDFFWHKKLISGKRESES